MRKLLKFKKTILTLLILALGGLIYLEVTAFAPSRLQTVNYSLSSSSIPQDFDNLTIAVFSDVYGNTEMLNKAIASFNMHNPDIVIFLGNLFNSPDETVIQNIIDALSSITAPLGKYAILGSHDDSMYQPVVDALNQSDFRLVQNRAVDIHRYTDAVIQFLFLDETNQEHSISTALSTLNTDQFTIAFMNNPNIVNALTDLNIPYAVAGETLGGKINIPFLGSLVFKDQYTQSNTKVGSTQLFLSYGLSSTEPNIRLFADPNILYLTLHVQN